MTAVSIVAHSRPFVVGVDTHARNHVYAIQAPATGALLETRQFPTTAAGINRAINWVGRRTDADADTLWVIKGAASYGAILASTVAAHGYPVAETPRMDAKKRRGVGKSDALDAHQIAAATLGLPEEKLRQPRAGDRIRQSVRILVTARDSMSKGRTRSVNALTALVRGNDLGIDARKSLTAAQITESSRWRDRREELSISIARTEAIRLATHILDLDGQLTANEQQLDELVKASEAAFASLAGVNPIPASSGNTVRHRLNRGGDRTLNSTLHMVAISRMTHDTETRQYVEKRRAEHKTDKEIRRCIKRYLARRVYRTLNASTAA